MKTEEHGIDFSMWLIELSDGAFQLQREFLFDTETDAAGFERCMGSFMASPHMVVSTVRGSRAPASLKVRIRILPERHLLHAAGDIAAACEYEYSLIRSHQAQTAA